MNKHAWKAHALWVILALFAGTAFNWSGLDHYVTRLAFDPISKSFPLRDAPLFAAVLHNGLKYASVGLWFGLFVHWVAGRSSKREHPSLVGYLLLSSGIAAFTVAMLKGQSAHSCPWDLTEFGGNADFFPIGLGTLVAGMNPGPGKCFPSGHASVGWMWIGAWLVNWPRADRLIKAVVLIVSLLASVTQIVRGAHFVSHVVISAAICLGVAALVLHTLPRHRKNFWFE